MEKYIAWKQWRRCRRGFSLVTVLLVTIIGVALLGGIFFMLGTFAPASAVSVAQGAEYNVLQQGVERGKAILKERMDNEDPPPLWTDKPDATATIDSVEMLLIPNGKVIDENVGKDKLSGRSGRLVVCIYDVQYDPNLVNITDPNKLALLPPSLVIPAPSIWRETKPLDPDESAPPAGLSGNAGAYLIRATLDIGGEIKMFDSAVIQSNSKKEE